MKRKLFIMLATLMAVASKSDAQININVNLPRIVKFVDVIESDVNLRKSSSASSPKLMLKNYSRLVWSGTPQAKGAETYHIPLYYAVPVLEEAEEWYKIALPVGRQNCEYAYIMKKFCRDVIEKVSYNANNRYEDIIDDELMTTVRKTGKYKGYCIEHKTGPGGNYARIGRVIDNMLVWTHRIDNFTRQVDLLNASDNIIESVFGQIAKQKPSIAEVSFSINGSEFEFTVKL